MMPLYKDADWLCNEYISEGKRTVEIAECCGVSPKTIRVWLKRFEIPFRVWGEDLGHSDLDRQKMSKIKMDLYKSSKHPRKDTKHTEESRRKMSESLIKDNVDADYRKKDWLYEAYVNKEKSTNQIGEECGVSKDNIRYYLLKYNIPIRSTNEAQKLTFEVGRRSVESYRNAGAMSSGFAGHNHTLESIKLMSIANSMENHPQWLDGISFEPYGVDFNKGLREEIRERDNYTCQECSKTQEELGWKLDVHHIDYDKTNNNPENLICLCRSCHAKTNFNREDWKMYYQNRMGECRG